MDSTGLRLYPKFLKMLWKRKKSMDRGHLNSSCLGHFIPCRCSLRLSEKNHIDRQSNTSACGSQHGKGHLKLRVLHHVARADQPRPSESQMDLHSWLPFLHSGVEEFSEQFNTLCTGKQQNQVVCLLSVHKKML